MLQTPIKPGPSKGYISHILHTVKQSHLQMLRTHHPDHALKQTTAEQLCGMCVECV